jgi:vacuolar-type H+-ATPase subunit H
VKKATAQKPRSIGQLIDRMDEIRDAKRKLAEQEKVLTDEYNTVKQELLERFDKEGMEKATGTRASASASKVVVANVVDYEKFCAYVKKTGHFHLFQRRISDPAFRELYEISKGKGVPGLEPFIKLDINLRSIAGAPLSNVV